jgi:transposase
MLRLPSLGELDAGLGVRIYLCTGPTDMRKGFDTLAALVRDYLGHDPLSGHLFLFVGRDRDRLKMLYWDTDGFALWYKRLEEGTFRLPLTPRGEVKGLPAASKAGVSVELKPSELAMLLAGIDLTSIKRRKRFVKPA